MVHSIRDRARDVMVYPDEINIESRRSRQKRLSRECFTELLCTLRTRQRRSPSWSSLNIHSCRKDFLCAKRLPETFFFDSTF
jgi:hypothetical protein